MAFINCPWCTQRNNQADLECRKCGGPLPTMSGSDPGPNPPLPPRTLPQGYKQKMMFRNSPLTLIGIIFFFVGFPLGIIFTIVGLIPGMWLMIVIGGGIGGLFTLLGIGMGYFGIQQGLKKIRPFEHGHATIGEIVEIYQDTSISVNGRFPWAVIYTFRFQGIEFEGKAISWNRAVQNHAVKDRVHVLYLMNDPEQSVIYPPL